MLPEPTNKTKQVGKKINAPLMIVMVVGFSFCSFVIAILFYALLNQVEKDSTPAVAKSFDTETYEVAKDLKVVANTDQLIYDLEKERTHNLDLQEKFEKLEHKNDSLTAENQKLLAKIENLEQQLAEQAGENKPTNTTAQAQPTKSTPPAEQTPNQGQFKISVQNGQVQKTIDLNKVAEKANQMLGAVAENITQYEQTGTISVPAGLVEKYNALSPQAKNALKNALDFYKATGDGTATEQELWQLAFNALTDSQKPSNGNPQPEPATQTP